jgi:hypothetical protein
MQGDHVKELDQDYKRFASEMPETCKVYFESFRQAKCGSNLADLQCALHHGTSMTLQKRGSCVSFSGLRFAKFILRVSGWQNAVVIWQICNVQFIHALRMQQFVIGFLF